MEGDKGGTQDLKKEQDNRLGRLKMDEERKHIKSEMEPNQEEEDDRPGRGKKH